MKVNTNINNNMKRSARGFTLIEMVGVLAVIAILAALLVPKIFQAINDSKISSSVSTLNTCKTATMSYYASVNKFPTNDAAFDKTLMSSNLLDSPFQLKLGDGWTMHAVSGGTASPSTGYDLDGAGSPGNSTTNRTVVECVIKNVSIDDAIQLSKRIDGDTGNGITNILTVVDPTAADSKGRVWYAAPVSGLTDVYVYLAHK